MVKSLNGLADAVTLSAGANVTITPSGNTLTVASTGGGGGGSGWSLTGNSGTIPGTDFLGTSDNESLELWVNNTRALLLQPGSGGYPDLIGGGATNSLNYSTIDPSVGGGTIAGGVANVIKANASQSTIGGGAFNQIRIGAGDAAIAGGYGNTTEAGNSMIGGGSQNYIQTNAIDAAIAGGQGNNIAPNSKYTFIGGGINNHASGIGAVIGGGGYDGVTYSGNNASGAAATIPGGLANSAAGNYSFAAGNQAQAMHTGAFVWADTEGTTFASTSNNQFSVRADGGVRFVTGGAGVTVDGVALGTAALAIPPGMALIPAGSFTMGNSIGDGDITDANPTNVTVSAFYMDVNLVSYAQWQSVYFWATNHGYSFDFAGSGNAPNQPVNLVNWYDVVKWSNARSQQAGLTPVYYNSVSELTVYEGGDGVPFMDPTQNGYRLPTEAEWEKAARGGLSGQRFPWGNLITENLANYYGDTIDYSYDLGPNGYNPIGNYPTTAPGTSPVGYFAANGYGLYDMAGNVEEWCWDWYGTPYGQPTTTNPTGAGPGSGYRVLRGGGWDGNAYLARCAGRNDSDPRVADDAFGFRCVRGH